MIFFDNPWILNWVFIVGYAHLALMLMLICSFGFKVAHVLLDTIRPFMVENVVDKNTVSFVEGLEVFLRRVKVLVVAPCLMFLLIIWVPLTQTASTPGLNYFFYFEFFVTIPLKIGWVFIVNKAAWRDRDAISRRNSSNGSHGSGSNHEVTVEKKASKDFSYTLDELTGNAGVEMQQA